MGEVQGTELSKISVQNECLADLLNSVIPTGTIIAKETMCGVEASSEKRPSGLTRI
jgi:hypothetical protein